MKDMSSRCLMCTSLLIHTSFLFSVADVQTLRYQHLEVISSLSEQHRSSFSLKVPTLGFHSPAGLNQWSRDLFSQDHTH